MMVESCKKVEYVLVNNNLLTKKIDTSSKSRVEWEIEKRCEELYKLSNELDIIYKYFYKNKCNTAIRNLDNELSELGHSSVVSLSNAKHLLLTFMSYYVRGKEYTLQYDNNLKWIPSHILVNTTADETIKLINYNRLLRHKKFSVCSNKEIREIRRAVFKGIEVLTESGIIREKVVTVQNKTIKLKSLNICIDIPPFEWDFYKNPSILIETSDGTYCTNVHYSSLHKIYKKNHKYDYSSIQHISHFKFLENILTLKLYPETKNISEIKKIILNTNNLKENDYINGDYLRMLEDDMKQKNIKYKTPNVLLQHEWNLTLEIFYILSYLNNISNHLSGFYLSLFLDFRFRIYTYGRLSPTFNKLIRLMLNYGVYTSEELKIIEIETEHSRTWSIIKEYSNLLYNQTCKFLKNYEIAGIFWSLIEISKVSKVELTTNGGVSIVRFIEHGWIVFRKYENSSLSDIYVHYKNLEDVLIIHNAISVINNILNKKQITKTIFFKDATASVLQHLIKILGNKDDLAMQYCNFTDNTGWWDPYHFIINEYLKNNQKYALYLNRKTLKKMIMTFNYSSTLRTNIEYVFFEIKKMQHYKHLSPDEKKKISKELVKEIKNFYTYLKNSYEMDLFFINKSETIVNEWDYSSGTISTYDGIVIPLNYNKQIKKRMNISTKLGDRKTLIQYYNTNNIDKPAIKRSLRANIIHASDAQFARLILNKYKIISVHDSFGIDIFNMCKFMDDVNRTMSLELIKLKSHETYNISLQQKIFSIFILL